MLQKMFGTPLKWLTPNPEKGEVCTATSAMIALHCASQQSAAGE